MKLFLCEKPSQAKDIAKVLGVLSGRNEGYYQLGDTAVTWAFGHILSQAMPDAYGEQFAKFGNINVLPVVPETWKMLVSTSAKKQFEVIKKLLKSADEVIIATDADREGEVIARELLDYCGYNKEIKRLWLQALDEASIKKALAAIMPGAKKLSLYMAGLARSHADWLIGMNLSRAYTVAYSAGFGKEFTLSIGRVQTPTLALIVKRDALIDNFVSYAHYALRPVFKTKAGEEFAATWQIPEAARNADGFCVDKALVAAIAKALLNSGTQALVVNAKTERKAVHPPLPYSLSVLQKEASKRFNVSVSKVLDVAQALYEKFKVTSYPRTSCQYLPLSQKSDVPKILTALVQVEPSIAALVQKADPTRDARVWNDKQVAKASHHAIIPTAVTRANLAEMSQLERDIYDMIRRRYLAQFYPDYEYDATVVQLSCVEQVFVANGNVIKAAGWKQVTQDDNDSIDKKTATGADNQLPVLEQNDIVLPQQAKLESKKTAPPARFTEATLLDEMKTLKSVLGEADEQIKKIMRDTQGLGTEATRGNIIQLLLERVYVEKKTKGQLFSTEKAKSLIAKIPPSVADPITTAKWELALSGIENGELSYERFMDAQVELLTGLVNQAKQVAAGRKKPTA